jgi:tryptophan synthase alpha chain
LRDVSHVFFATLRYIMSRIEEVFRSLKAMNKKAFIPYIMAGDPSIERTQEIVRALAVSGADIVELGVPFTDPLADGPMIQRAAERALKAGVTLRKVIWLVRELRKETGIPLILMTYYNPVFKYGLVKFINDAVAAGVNGVIVPDLPPDEAADLMRPAQAAGLDTIFLIAPTSTRERMKKVAEASKGFIYYVSLTGITGSKISLDGSLEESIHVIRSFTEKPVAVGFGVSTPKEAYAVAQIADGVIIGSAIVKKIHESPGHLRTFLRELRAAIR